MGFCSESFDFDGLMDKLFSLADDIGELAGGSFGDVNEVIEQLALASDLFTKLTELKDFIVNKTMAGLLCEILNKLELDEYIGEIENFVGDLDGLIRELDALVTNADGELSFEEVENIINGIFSEFEDEKESIEEMIRDILRTVFSPLVAIGASQATINAALEDTMFQPNIKQYIFDVFDNILRDVLEKYRSKNP